MYQPAIGGSASQAPYGFATPVRTPSTSYHNAYSQALTPASASKEVRFQSQPLPQQTQQQQQQQQQSSALTSTSTPNKSPYHNAVSTPAASSSAVAQSATPNRAPAAATSKPAASAMSAPSPQAANSSVSSIALTRRFKWNVAALGLLWLVPALSTKPRDAYWAVLDVIYMYVGGEADELVDGIVGWILWALSVVLLFNALEAVIQMRRTTPRPNTTVPQPGVKDAKGAVLGIHSPQVAKSINFVAASRLKGSPKTRTSTIGPGSPISQHRASPGNSAKQGAEAGVDYAQFSPSLRRTSSPIPSPSSYRVGSSTGVEYVPSPSTTTTMMGSASSPLAAFRARHSSVAAGGQRGSPTPSQRSLPRSGSVATEVDVSFDQLQDNQEDSFLGDESFEVERALKSLRNSMGGGGAISSTPAPFR